MESLENNFIYQHEVKSWEGYAGGGFELDEVPVFGKDLILMAAEMLFPSWCSGAGDEEIDVEGGARVTQGDDGVTSDEESWEVVFLHEMSEGCEEVLHGFWGRDS